ncbi:MAG: LacI family DNA-binding transcriptional regulator [Aristaeellaceae bacterium]
MAATIKDIAQRTGLGLATISKYLNGGHVKPANQAAIEEAIRALDYKVNETARSLKTRRTGYVGLLLPALNNQFMTDIINEMQYELRLRNLGSALCCIPSGNAAARRQGEMEAVDFLLQKGVDGVINLPLNEDGAHLTRVLAQHIPVTLIDKQIPELASQVSAVIVDNVSAARMATDELINAGHRRILGLFLAPQNYTARRRHEGFCDALRERSIPGDSARALFYEQSSDEAFRATVAETIREMGPTAVLATTSSLTRTAVQVLDSLGLRIPEDVSVIGYDGAGTVDSVGMKLYSVVQPTRDIGVIAAQIMAMQIDAIARGKAMQPQVRTLSARMISGASLRTL